MQIDAFLEKLDEYQDRVPLDELTALLRQIETCRDDIADCAQFNDMHYQRNLLREGPAYQALVLCWKAGQSSPIHDHRGSSCGVLVIAGTATETTFRRTEAGRLFSGATRELSQGSVCGSQDADIHQVSNLQEDGSPLVTLHVYSPPLVRMGTYSLTEPTVGVFEDPVREAARSE